MSQFSQSIQTRTYRETPASIEFFTHLACDLFYGILLIVSLAFAFWSVQIFNQVNPATLQSAGITSLESSIGTDGKMDYYVVYTVSTETNQATQAVSYQQKRISEEMFHTLKDKTTLPVNITSINPLETQIVPQAVEHDRLVNTLIPAIMVLLSLSFIMLFGFLFIRSVSYSVQSISLNRYGVTTYGVIRKRTMEKHSDRETEYTLIYQFETNGDALLVQAAQSVSFSRFRSMQIGEVVRVRFHPHKPHLSRIEF